MWLWYFHVIVVFHYNQRIIQNSLLFPLHLTSNPKKIISYLRIIASLCTLHRWHRRLKAVYWITVK